MLFFAGPLPDASRRVQGDSFESGSLENSRTRASGRKYKNYKCVVERNGSFRKLSRLMNWWKTARAVPAVLPCSFDGSNCPIAMTTDLYAA